jgi:hypothetical protein
MPVDPLYEDLTQLYYTVWKNKGQSLKDARS